MRDCVEKLAELFDLLGRITPLIVGMKLDVSILHRAGLGWEDILPDNSRLFRLLANELMQEIKGITYRRAIVPCDAKYLNIFTLDTGDASSKLICAAIYARFERKCGSFSCQLVFSRSKVTPEGISIPRAELMAACMNGATGHTVKKAFGNYHKESLKFSDSMVALHWIASTKMVLDTWVRNHVVEINRLCELSIWRYVESRHMIADIGTRKGAKIPDVIEGSKWIYGLQWMTKPVQDFPSSTIDELKLNQNDLEEAEKEKICIQSFYNQRELGFDTYVDEQVKLRYELSNYIIDPDRFRFRKVVRILALVLTFVKKIAKKIVRVQNGKTFNHRCPSQLPKVLHTSGDRFILTTGCLKDSTDYVVGGKVIELLDEMLKSTLYYLSLKTTQEVKTFIRKGRYANISEEINWGLYYVGRIPANHNLDGYPDLCTAAIDLCSTTFCVPVMDQYSPVAISIVMEIHWQHPDVKHTGIETMLRQTHWYRDHVKTNTLV